MSQHDLAIADDDGATVLSDMSAGLQAVASLHSGPTAPTTTWAYMLWADTTAALLKQRNSANNGWITLGKLSGFMGAGVSVGLSASVLDTDLTQLVVSADRFVMDGVPITTVSATLDTNTSAGTINAIQTGGSWSTNTWYEILGTCKDDASAHGLFACVSGGTPTKPSSYDRAQHLGWVRTKGTATDLWPLRQRGNVVTWASDSADHKPLSLSNPSYTFVDVDCSAQVPPGVRRAIVQVYVESNGSLGAGTSAIVYVRENGATPTTGRKAAAVRGPNQCCLNQIEVDVDANRIFEIAMANPGIANTNFNIEVEVIGWLDHKLAA